MSENRIDVVTKSVLVAGVALTGYALIKYLLRDKDVYAFSYVPISIRSVRVTVTDGVDADAALVNDVEFTVGVPFQLQVSLDLPAPPGRTYEVEITPKVVADIKGDNKLDLMPLNNPQEPVELTMNPSGPLVFTAIDQAPKTIDVTVTSIASDVHLIFTALRKGGPGKKRAGIALVLVKE